MQKVPVVLALMVVLSAFVLSVASQNNTTQPSCGPGTHLANGQCVSDTPPPPSCGPDQHVEGDHCVNNQPPPGNQSQPQCGPDQHLENGHCVNNQPPPPSCPAGQSWDVNRRECNTPGQVCSEGFYWDGQSCQPSHPQCPPDSYYDYRSKSCQRSSGNYTPPQQCSPGQYYDYHKQACVNPPPQCGPDQYYDHSTGACKSFEHPDDRPYSQPAQGGYPQCGPESYCPPPPQHACAPDDYYCRPPPDENCGEKLEGVRYELESLFQAFGQEMEAFHKKFESDRHQFSREKHSQEEWQAWGEKWREEGTAIGNMFQEKYMAFINGRDLGPCARYMPPPPFFGGPGGPGGGLGGPPGGGGRGGPGDHFDMGPPQDNRFYEEDEAVRKIREECEAQMKELYGESTGPGGPGDNPEKREKMKALMKDCERRVREHFQQFYEDEVEFEDREESFGSFEMFFDEEEMVIQVSGKYTSFVGNPDSQVLSEFSCGGQLFLDQAFVNGYLEEFEPEETEEGTALIISTQGRQIISIHDNPRCTMNLATSSTVKEITLDFADYLDIDEGENGYTFTDGEVSGKLLKHSGRSSEDDGNVIELKGKWTLLMSKSHATKAAKSAFVESDELAGALEEGNIGAEVIVALDKKTEGKVKVDSTPYGDMEVAVELEDEDTVSANIESDSEDGKTVVLAFDKDIFSSPDLAVGVFAVEEDDDGETSETEEDCVQEAKNLEDALDPNNDGDCHEWWVVQDKLGVHVLVSIYHFSEKRVEISSVGTSSVGPLPGFEFAAWSLGLLAAAGLVGSRLRRDE